MATMPIEADMSTDGATSQLTSLYEDHKNLLFGFVLSIVGSRQDAEDVIQTLFQKLWKDRSRWNRVESWKPWLLKLARNQAIDHIKQSSRSKKREEIVGAEDFLQPPPEMDAHVSEQIQHLLRTLDEVDRSLVMLKIFQDMTFEEIGVVLQISGSTASTRYYKILGDLKSNWRKMEL